MNRYFTLILTRIQRKQIAEALVNNSILWHIDGKTSSAHIYQGQNPLAFAITVSQASEYSTSSHLGAATYLEIRGLGFPYWFSANWPKQRKRSNTTPESGRLNVERTWAYIWAKNKNCLLLATTFALTLLLSNPAFWMHVLGMTINYVRQQDLWSGKCEERGTTSNCCRSQVYPDARW